MKISAIIRIVIFSLVILLLSFILLSVLDHNYYIESGRVHSYEEVGQLPTEALAQINQHDISAQVQNIEIEWVAGSIIIQQSDSLNSIIVAESCPTYSEYETVIKQSGQTLKIQFCEESMEFPSFGINADVSKDLVIRVPKNWNCNTLEIDAAAAEVHIYDLSINEMDFDGASGDLILDNCNIVDLDIDTASGDVEFTGTLKELDFDAASAKFYGEFLAKPNHLNLDAMSGDVELVLPEYCWFTCELETMSGSFDTDFATKQENNVYVYGGKDNACHVRISAMSGDVSILKGVSVPQSAAGNGIDNTNCTDSNCTDPSHDHSEICNDKNCTDASHDHSNHH